MRRAAVSSKVVWVIPIVILALVCESRDARADPREKLVGFGAGLFSPGFEAQDRTAPALLSWAMQAFALYGPDWGPRSWDLALGVSVSWATYSGVSRDYTHHRDGEAMHGDLFFTGAVYHPELFVQYKLLSGWDVAPYVEAGLGALWATYRDATLHDVSTGQQMGSRVDDFGRGGVTASLALKVDWRVASSVRLGVAAKYTRSSASLLKWAVSVPVTLAYHWW
jgi:hypothetical protein